MSSIVLSNSRDSVWSRMPGGGVTTPLGFMAAGITAGLKTSGKPDVALLLAPQGAICAGTFTSSSLRAACVDLSAERLKASDGRARAVLINSGQANAFTGDRGLKDSLRATQSLADRLGLDPEQVLICSTGVIGVPIPIDSLLHSLDELVDSLSENGGEAAANAILTTDLVDKQFAVEADFGGRKVRIGGMAKGSGMIHPNMATMLGYLSCDAFIPKEAWLGMIQRVVGRSFNAITVDGDTSTNDAFIAFAAGEPLQEVYFDDLERGLTLVTQSLAKFIARDGEGATCLLQVEVQGANSDSEALLIARTVCGSSLVKTAVHGKDPNWGRIVASVGRVGVTINQDDFAIWLGPYQLVANGNPLAFDLSLVSKYMQERINGTYLVDDTVDIRIVVGSGNGHGMSWGCDLTAEYVRINADYTT